MKIYHLTHQPYKHGVRRTWMISENLEEVEKEAKLVRKPRIGTWENGELETWYEPVND